MRNKFSINRPSSPGKLKKPIQGPWSRRGPGKGEFALQLPTRLQLLFSLPKTDSSAECVY